MEDNCNIAPPVNLNCWKHHASFIKAQVDSLRSLEDIEQIRKCLLKIGESQMDLYLGEFSPEKIAAQIINSLQRKKIFSSDDYQQWLKKDNKDYQLIALSDKSAWTLRLGENPDRYVHIHPGRYSPQTIRVKATTLKTAILVLALKQIQAFSEVDAESVNYIRKKYLNEPPLKSLMKSSGLIRLLDLFQNKICL